MRLLVCVDKSNGMAFNHRRQSQDAAVISKILELTAGAPLWMNAYSAPLFAGAEVLVDEQFLQRAEAGDFCFAERDALSAEAEQAATEVYRFNWNRDYPADTYFTMDLAGYTRIKKTEFEGNSHKKITLEIFRKDTP